VYVVVKGISSLGLSKSIAQAPFFFNHFSIYPLSRKHCDSL